MAELRINARRMNFIGCRLPDTSDMTHSDQHMLRNSSVAIILVMLALITCGCVSSGTFKKMEEQKNDELTELKQQKSELEIQKQTLEQERSALQGSVNDLKQQLASLEQQKAEMGQQTESLKQENAAITSANQRQRHQYDSLVNLLATEVAHGMIQVHRYKNMLTVDLTARVFFDSGRATLKSDGRDVLMKLGGVLKGYDNKLIWVVGHTDNVPVAKSLQAIYPTNWELSVARATNVVRLLQESGVPPQRLVSSGRAEYDPVGPNDTPDERQKNRRIEIMLIDQSLVNELSQPGN